MSSHILRFSHKSFSGVSRPKTEVRDRFFGRCRSSATEVYGCFILGLCRAAADHVHAPGHILAFASPGISRRRSYFPPSRC